MISLLQRIEARPVRPSRPEMPTYGKDFEPWKQQHMLGLRMWFRWCYGKDPVPGTEWEAFCTLQYVAEQEVEGL